MTNGAYNETLASEVERLRRHIAELEAETHRGGHERAQLESPELLKTVFDSSPIAVAVFDKNGTLVRANPRAAELAEVDIRHLVGRLNLQDAPGYRNALVWDQLRRGEPAPLEIEFDPARSPYPTTKRGRSNLLVVTTPIPDSLSTHIGYVVQILDITERKRTEAALDAARARTNAILEGIADTFYSLDTEWKFTTVNPAAEKAPFGRPAKEMLGRCLWDLYPELLGTVIHQHYLDARKKGGLEHYEARSPLNGRWYEVFLQGWTGGLDVYMRDVTKRKQAEEALRESEEEHRIILRTAMDGFWVVDLKGRLTQVNETYCLMSGYAEHELLNRHISDLTIKSPAQIAAELRDLVVRGENRFESRHRRKDGTEFDVEVSVKYHAIDGGRLVVFLRDITERKRAEDERQRLQAQLFQAQKMEAVGRLAGGVAHDFNNMLAAILANTEFILEQVEPSSQLAEDVREIRKAAEHSTDLTRQLLAFARKQTVSPRVLDLNEAVSGTLSMLRHLVGESVHVRWVPKDSIGPIRMDPAQLNQILANLCVNARDAITDVGRITIETSRCHVDEAFCAEHPDALPGEYVVLSVTDDGCGMDQTTIAKLFEPFFTTKELGRGTGLGLSTIHGIVKQNGGHICVRSDPGQGTTFTIYLPLFSSSSAAPKVSASSAEHHPRGTILLVEDEPAVLRVSQRMLESLGYEVVAANGPREATRLARDHAGPIHLLITDIVMPEVNGRTLARDLLSLFPTLRCLFMSGYTADVIANQGVLDEDLHFLQKPFNRDDLAVMVRKALGG